jgi:predicted dehydrogenase
VLGYGYWGPNLARNIAARGDAVLAAICDANAPRRDAARQMYPGTEIVERYEAVLEDESIDGIALATPAATHQTLGMAALRAGKHLLVEKPLAMTVADGAELVAAAEVRDRVLMVGHTFLYEAAVRHLATIVARGDIGSVASVYAQRLNLGRIRTDVNAMWNLAPHDVSILLYVLGQKPIAVSARGVAATQPDIEDTVFMNVEFDSGTLAHVHVSWLDPTKMRRMVVIGSRGMVVYDDVSRDAPIVVHDKGIDASTEPGGFTHRDGGEMTPAIDRVEPLALECAEFVECVRSGREPLTSGRQSLDVVRVLEAAQRSLDRHGDRVDLDEVRASS